MSHHSEVTALRTTAALSTYNDTLVIEVEGEHAWDLLDRVLPTDLYLRDGQARQALLLHDDGRVAADITVLCADTRFWLLVEGTTADEVLASLQRHALAGEEAEVRDRSGELAVLGLDGPFAWEPLAAVAGRGAIGLPLLSFFAMDEGPLCLRDGRLGEFGYRFVVSHEGVEGLRDRLRSGAQFAGFSLPEASESARQTCMLENHSFCVAREGASDLHAGELQLGWRLSADKSSPALDAVHASQDRRTVTFRARRAPSSDVVIFEGSAIGTVMLWEPCQHGEGVIGLLAVDEALAHPGIDAFSAGGVPLRTVSPPLIANRSLYINPQHHRFAEQDAIAFPEDPATSQAPPR